MKGTKNPYIRQVSVNLTDEQMKLIEEAYPTVAQRAAIEGKPIPTRADFIRNALITQLTAIVSELKTINK